MRRRTLVPLILAGSLALMGSQCEKDEIQYEPATALEKDPNAPKPVEMVDYFGSVFHWSNDDVSVALTSDDFDGDGDKDLITLTGTYGRLQFFENDGKGNFTQRMYPAPVKSE